MKFCIARKKTNAAYPQNFESIIHAFSQKISIELVDLVSEFFSDGSLACAAAIARFFNKQTNIRHGAISELARRLARLEQLGWRR